MKRSINLGAYGWQHTDWNEHFYPDDLPVDWQLTYYSNMFSCVLVPASYWQIHSMDDCAQWIDQVPDDFQFVIECDEIMFSHASPLAITDCLKGFQSQLSALIFLDKNKKQSVKAQANFVELKNNLAVDIDVIKPQAICHKKADIAADLAVFESDLTDLRAAREMIEHFNSALDAGLDSHHSATIIVKHAHLQPANLSKFRAVLELMGY